MEVVYTVMKSDGIYEVLRVDSSYNFIVVQTNIRTEQKAKEACRTWKNREASRLTNSQK